MGSPLARSVSLPVTADESLVGKEGYLVYPKGSAGSEELALADDGATQAANQALAILGVCIAGAAANATAEARQTGVVDCIAGTGGVTIGDYIVAETGTGKGITLGAANSGINYVAGQALTSASADGYFQLDLDARCVFFGSAGFGAGSTSTLDMDDAAATLTGALAAADIYAVDPEFGGRFGDADDGHGSQSHQRGRRDCGQSIPQGATHQHGRRAHYACSRLKRHH